METENLSPKTYTALKYAIELGDVFALSRLAELTGQSVNAAGQTLGLLEKKELVERAGRGVYRAKAGVSLENYTSGRMSGTESRPRASATNPRASIERAMSDLVDAVAELAPLIMSPEDFEELKKLRELKAVLEGAGAKFKK